MPTQAPPGMMYMGSRLVPISKPFASKAPVLKKFLVVVQHYDGDVQMAEELVSLISDLERTRNHDADILLVRRSDSREISTTFRLKLEAKFDKVMLHACRRVGARGYPYAPNEMFYDLVTLVAQYAPYKDEYYAFINLEPDAVPTRPGWIGELIAEWRQANQEGKAAIGYIHNNPVTHMNGLAVYAIDMWKRVGSNILAGGGPQVCYDIRHAKSILPLAKSTPLINFHYRHSTTTPEEVFAEKNGIAPAIFHGVKDRSALTAVRDRHIGMKSTPLNAPKRPNVYTYFQKLTGTSIEDQAILDTWRQGWSTRGWNPVILSERDAIKHLKFAEYGIKIEKLPVAGDKNRIANKFFRWLALDQVGGGLMVDYDALPGEFTPERISLDGGPLLLRSDPADHLFGIWMNRQQSSDWIKEIMAYDAQPDDLIGDKPNVSDDTIARRSMLFEFACMDNPPVKHFGAKAVGNERKSVAMQQFLRGVPV